MFLRATAKALSIALAFSALASCGVNQASQDSEVAPENGEPIVSPIDMPLSVEGRPNIVLILFEDLSPRFGAYGDDAAHTPNFDRIASESLLFTKTFTAAPVCAPSRASLITGRHPQTIGAQHMRTSGAAGLSGGGPQEYLAVPPPEVKAFPELLRAAGYYTSNGLKTDYQFGEPISIWNANGAGADWSGREEGQPFFAMINLLTTHESFVWPADLQSDSPIAKFVLNRNAQYLRDRPERTDPDDVVVPAFLPDTPIVRRDIAAHYDNVAFTDQVLGQLYQRLDQEGFLENTVIIVSTDHGDGLPRMKRSLYDGGLHVPMLIRLPGAVGGGTVVDELVSFVDLAPTILKWAEVTPPEWMQGQVIQGPGRDDPREVIYASLDRMDRVEGRRRAVRDDRYKLIVNDFPGTPFFEPLAFRDIQPTMQELWRGHAEETLTDEARLAFEPLPKQQLYDTLNDPDEVENLSGDPDHAAIEAKLLRQLNDWRNQIGDVDIPSEAEMIERMWPGGEQPVTDPPTVKVIETGEGTYAELSSPDEGASIVYRLTDEEPWKLYTQAFAVSSGANLEAKAVRYGYSVSEVLDKTIP